MSALVAALVVALATGVSARLPAARRTRPASVVASPRRVHTRLTRRSRPPSDDDVAGWCDDIARRLRAGDTLSTAVRGAAASAALQPLLAPMLLALERGVPLAGAVQRSRAGPPPLAIALGVVGACAAAGGPAAQPIDRVAAALRLRAADSGERRAHSAQARMSAGVLTILPGSALVVMATVSPAIRAAIVTPLGVACLAAGSLLSFTGWRWMGRIIGAPS